MPFLSFMRLQLLSSLLFFLAHQLFKINFIGYFKESASGFVDFLSCFSVVSFTDIDFRSLVFIISFLLFALGSSSSWFSGFLRQKLRLIVDLSFFLIFACNVKHFC